MRSIVLLLMLLLSFFLASITFAEEVMEDVLYLSNLDNALVRFQRSGKGLPSYTSR